jgi:C_GCAxxG_C_C family probable redox protein
VGGPPLSLQRSVLALSVFARRCYTWCMADQHHIDTALARFGEGYNCSQSTFGAFAGELGLSADVALRIAAPFGGGIGRQGEVCGAASGALMALGLHFGSATAGKDGKERAYTVAAEFLRRFEARTGALHCRDLIQADMTTAEGLAGARERKVFTTLCPGIVAAAVEIADELLQEAGKAAT